VSVVGIQGRRAYKEIDDKGCYEDGSIYQIARYKYESAALDVSYTKRQNETRSRAGGLRVYVGNDRYENREWSIYGPVSNEASSRDMQLGQFTIFYPYVRMDWEKIGGSLGINLPLTSATGARISPGGSVRLGPRSGYTEFGVCEQFAVSAPTASFWFGGGLGYGEPFNLRAGMVVRGGAWQYYVNPTIAVNNGGVALTGYYAKGTARAGPLHAPVNNFAIGVRYRLPSSTAGRTGDTGHAGPTRPEW
jgi:hypothetical protein